MTLRWPTSAAKRLSNCFTCPRQTEEKTESSPSDFRSAGIVRAFCCASSTLKRSSVARSTRYCCHSTSHSARACVSSNTISTLPAETRSPLNHTAVEMLYALAVRLHLDKTVGYDCAVEGCRHCPGAESAKENGNDQPSGDRDRAHGIAYRERVRDVAFHCATFICATAPPVRLTDARRVNWAITSLRGPKSSTTPSLKVRSLSTTARVLGRCEIMTTVVPRFLSSVMQSRNASSPSESRFELGSSSTTRLGFP